jgi:hypothetical protein
MASNRNARRALGQYHDAEGVAESSRGLSAHGGPQAGDTPVQTSTTSQSGGLPKLSRVNAWPMGAAPSPSSSPPGAMCAGRAAKS